MARKSSHYGQAPKRAAEANPVVLGVRSTFWLFWSGVAIAAVLVAGATYWLLTHP